MTHYLINFVTYTFAVSGLLLAAMFIYKRTTSAIQSGKDADFLKVEHRLDLSARKTLYVVKAGNEKFLIASDVDKTTFLSKLDEEHSETHTLAKEKTEELSAFANIVELEKAATKRNSQTNEVKNFKLDEEQVPVLKSLLRKIGTQRG